MLRSLSISMLPAAALISTLLVLPNIGCGGDSAFDDAPKACTSGKLKCDGTCYDLFSSPDNCGKCGNACKDSEVCSQGTCKSICDDGFAKCNRACVNLYTNVDHCGTCGSGCDSDAICSLGKCTSSCSDKCGDTCTDLKFDANNCGKCGTRCAGDEVCSNGDCVDICELPETSCTGGCVINAANYKYGDDNPDNPCETCVKASKNAWSPKSPGTECGTGMKCNADRQCVGGCDIGGTVYPLLADHPSDKCQICSQTKPGEWENKGEGASCGNAGLYCDAANACAIGCVVGEAFFSQGADHPTNKCQKCSLTQPGSWEEKGEGVVCGSAGQYCNSGGVCSTGCTHGGKFFLPGTDHPGDTCKKCSSANLGDWDSKGEGASCGGSGQFCNASNICATGCSNGTAFVLPGSDHPSDRCKKCSTANPGSWDDKGAGASCGSNGEYCNSANMCVTGCAVGTSFILPGQDHPTDRCKKCSTTTAGTWDDKDEGASCGPAGQYCDASRKCSTGCTENGVFYAPNDDHPTNKCRKCSTAAAGGWEYKGQGASCGSAGQVCDATNTCGTGCAAGSSYVTPGGDHPTNKCQVCSPSGTGSFDYKGQGTSCGAAGQYCNASNICSTGCAVGTTFVSPGGDHPVEKCKKCSSITPGDWENKGESASCGGAGQYCNSSNTCSTGCVNGTKFTSQGGNHPTDTCQKCSVTKPGQWEAGNEGYSCGAGLYCDSVGKCSAGCAVGTTIVSPGGDHPVDKCKKCSSITPGEWEDKGESASCGGAGQYCNSSNTCSTGCVSGTKFTSQGEAHPTDTCQKCSVTKPGQWEAKIEGDPCGGAGLFCDSFGKCSTGCVDTGKFLTPGSSMPSNTCYSCLGSPVPSWVPGAEGSLCDGGSKYCKADGQCIEGCLWSGKVFAADENDPATCRVCTPGVSPGWVVGTGRPCTSAGGTMCRFDGACVKTLSITAGWRGHSCGVTETGDVYCWGDNGAGQLGTGDTVERTVPTLVPGLHHITAVTLASYFTCALSAFGTVQCWGEGTEGKLGDGMNETRWTPTDPFLSNVVAISSGDIHTCVVTDTGKIKCWGSGYNWQLGTGKQEAKASPTDVNLPSVDDIAVSVAAGYQHTCAVTETDVVCWGTNDQGQCGQVPPPEPHPSGLGVELPTAWNMPTAWIPKGYISVGRQHTCFVYDIPAMANAQINCFGNNPNGQLGIDHASIQMKHDNQSRPFASPGFDGPAYTVQAGAAFTCTHKSHGVWCWGNNTSGQLGDGTTTTRYTPGRVDSLDSDAGVIGLSARGYHACALLNKSGSTSAKCWGMNSNGQLGIGTNSTRETVPQVVVGFPAP
ncbi:MAG: hypothetical protein FWD57_04865 [Polyangiaceae bacterium]|nr:hypothetical protein [Polyangiaceae bacterium]